GDEEEEVIEDCDSEVELGLGAQKQLRVLCAVNHVDAEITGEDERPEEDERPHIRLPGHEPRRLREIARCRSQVDLVRPRSDACEVRHRSALTRPGGAAAASGSTRSGSALVPKSSRRIIFRIRVMKTAV